VARDLPAAGVLVMLLALTIAPWTRRTGTARILAGGLLVAFGVVGIGALTEFGSVSFSGEPGAYRGTEQGALRDLVASQPIQERYFILPDPPPSLLRLLGFALDAR